MTVCNCPVVERDYDEDGDVIFDKEKIAKTLETINESNVVEYIIEYESTGMCAECTLAFFQYLINTGMAWSLQGFYGRTAQGFIDAGYCTRPEK